MFLYYFLDKVTKSKAYYVLNYLLGKLMYFIARPIIFHKSNSAISICVNLD